MVIPASNTRKILLFLFSAVLILLFLSISMFIMPAYRYSFFVRSAGSLSGTTNLQSAELKKLQKQAEALRKKTDRLSTPGNSFLIINTTDNTFRLYRNMKLAGSGLCSTGSLIHLEVDNTRSWLFETPKGVLRVRNKVVDPVWRKPDWAFIEEGIHPPPAGHPSRYETGVLGDYALDLGNGYLIHGTLYQRSLGMAVTHGCVRLNDTDLELVYNTLDIGSKVYIF